MRRLLIAAALGLGLLSAGGLTSTASANPHGHSAGQRPSAADSLIAPVHYERGFHRHGHYRPHYASPSYRHWQRYEPPARYYHPPRHHPSYDWRR
jgi:hypothetical protein